MRGPLAKHAQRSLSELFLGETEGPFLGADLLPVGYFHVAFTLPAEVANIARQNKAVVYDPVSCSKCHRLVV